MDIDGLESWIPMSSPNTTVEEAIRIKTRKVFEEYNHTCRAVFVSPDDYRRLQLELFGHKHYGFTHLEIACQHGRVHVIAKTGIPSGHVGTDRPAHPDDPPWTLCHNYEYGSASLSRGAIEAAKSNADAFNEMKKENEDMEWKIGTKNDTNARILPSGLIHVSLSAPLSRNEFNEFASKVNELFDISEEQAEE